MKAWAAQSGGNSKSHPAVDAHGMLARVTVTEDTRADCKEACVQIVGLSAGSFLAGGYDTESILRKAGESGCQVDISPKEKCKICVTRGKSSIKPDILLKMHFFISSIGGVLLDDMTTEALFFSPHLKSDVYLCGQT